MIKDVTEKVLKQINMCIERYLETGTMSFKDAFLLFRFSVLYGNDNQLLKLLSNPTRLKDSNIQEEVSDMLQEINKFNSLVDNDREKILKIDFIDIYLANKQDKIAKNIVKQYPSFPATSIKSIILLAECYGKLAELILSMYSVNKK